MKIKSHGRYCNIYVCGVWRSRARGCDGLANNATDDISVTATVDIRKIDMSFQGGVMHCVFINKIWP